MKWGYLEHGPGPAGILGVRLRGARRKPGASILLVHGTRLSVSGGQAKARCLLRHGDTNLPLLGVRPHLGRGGKVGHRGHLLASLDLLRLRRLQRRGEVLNVGPGGNRSKHQWGSRYIKTRRSANVLRYILSNFCQAIVSGEPVPANYSGYSGLGAGFMSCLDKLQRASVLQYVVIVRLVLGAGSNSGTVSSVESILFIRVVGRLRAI